MGKERTVVVTIKVYSNEGWVRLEKDGKSIQSKSWHYKRSYLNAIDDALDMLINERLSAEVKIKRKKENKKNEQGNE